MTSEDNFDADVEQGGEEEFSDASAGEGDAAESVAPAAPAKKSGGMGVKLLVLLVVLAGGAAGAVKMGFIHSPVAIPGLSPAAAPAPLAAATPHPPMAEKPAKVAAATPPVLQPQPVSGPAATPPDMSDIAPQSGEKPKEEAPSNPMMPPPVISSSPTAAPSIEAPAGAAPPAAAPVLPPVEAPALSAPPATGTAPAPEMAAPPAVGNAEDAAKLQKLDDRTTALEQSVKDLKDAQGSLATKADLDALKSDIDKLRQDMTQASSRPVAEKPAHARHVKAPAKAMKHAGAHRAAKASSVKVASGWILKSAKPGTAWVSQPGSPDIRSVSVGDTLPGLGKVTSISQDPAGHWVVSGTRGRINQ